MKRLILIILILFLVPPTVRGANEIRSFNAGATTCFAVIREIDGDVWHVVDQQFEPWGTDANDADDYDIALTDKSGGMFVGSFDTNISAGYYYIVSHQTADATPDDADPATWTEYGYWSGTAWNPYTLKTIEDKVDLIDVNDAGIADAVWDEALAGHTTETTFGGELGTLDPNITLILADTNELQTDQKDGGRLDLIWDAIKAVTDKLPMITTTVSDANDANSFTLTAGVAVADAYNGVIISIQDADDGHWEPRMVYDWTAAKVVIVDIPLGFTPAAGDVVVLWNVGYFPIDVYDNQLVAPPPGVITVDRTAGVTGGGGTPTFDVFDNDP